MPKKNRDKKQQAMVDMAAQLFAELFYRQVMMERETKLKEKDKDKKIDDKPKKSLK